MFLATFWALFFTNSSGHPAPARRNLTLSFSVLDLSVRSVTRLGDVAIFKIFSPKNLAKVFAVFLLKLLLGFANIVIITLVFEKNAKFFCRKLAKIGENCDYNIDRRLGEFSSIG
jgi:hypothetical protein